MGIVRSLKPYQTSLRQALFAGLFAMAALTTPVASAEPAPPRTTTPSTQPSLSDLVSHISPSVVEIYAEEARGTASGSGVRIAAGILTNAHVVQDARSLQIYTDDYRSAPATILRIDPDLDLALLRADISLPPVDMEGIGDQHLADDVLVLGYPERVRDNLEKRKGGPASISRGLISGILHDEKNDRLLIQTDAAVNHGNSGGAMVNMHGKLIGVPTLGTAPGISFAIATNTVQAFLAKPLPPPQPAYRGTARDIALRSSDLADNWTLLDEATDRGVYGSYTALFAGTNDADNDPKLAILVMIVPTINEAKDDFASFSALTLDGLDLLPKPGFGDDAIAATTDGQMIVLVRTKNVILGVQETTQGDLATDVVLGAARTMALRVDAGSR